jgi:hypothetical protein
MHDAGNTEKICQDNLHQKRPNGRPKTRCKNDVENGVGKIGIVTCREVEQDRDGGRRATRQALILLR